MWIIISLIFVIAIGILILSSKEKIQPIPKCNTQTCGSNNSKLLPIMDPAFNLRESSKQMILLEDHLSCAGKLCQDCVKKHLLMIEGLLEEALSLDMNGDYKQLIEHTIEDLRNAEKAWLKGGEPCTVSHMIRKIRKPLHTKFFAVGL